MKKDNKFIFYHLKILFIILITISIFIIPANTILASPLSLTNVPLDSWVYPAISRLETLQAFNGNDSIALNTIPLSRIKIAFLIDTALSNIQEGKVKLKQTDLLLMDKLVKEFHAELSALVLSDNPPAFDMFKYFGVIDLNDSGESMAKINFTKFFSLLDTLDEQNRYFSGQRIEYKPFDALTLGLSETAVISYDSSLLFINPIPFIPPYYITRWIADQINQPSEINSNVGIDIELNFSPGIKLYGEWMADDFILTPKTNPYPNRTGFLTGVYFAEPLGSGNTDFRIEYTHINNYVYFSTHPWQDYLYQGEFIGHSLGPDADQLYLGLTHQLLDSLNLSLSYTHERHGEGQVGIPLPPDPVVANENIFLSGIIEKQQAYQVEISYTISPQWELSAGITRENIKNKDNNPGANENNTYFQIELEYQF